ncbi:MAG TPA: hypothetical protein PLP19_05305 [bacterium]|nr:hypothetical protein [bacterium]HPN42888.1 hypothetical protein [bacterium]
MPARITPLDVKNYADNDVYECGKQIFENNLVKYRFQTDYGLKATVRDNGNNVVEMVVEDGQLFGRCTCAAGSRPCKHKVAMLLAWLAGPGSFISFSTLRKTIRDIDKNTLVELYVNLAEAMPELSSFFAHESAQQELHKIPRDVALALEIPAGEKVGSFEVIEACKILLVRARYLRHENKWEHARTLLFEILHCLLKLLVHNRLDQSLPEGYLADIADSYEETTLSDPDFDIHRQAIRAEYDMLISHPAAENEGVYLEQLVGRLK